MDWKDRENKQLSREYVLDGYLQEYAAVFLPGWDETAGEAGQDIRYALEQGMLDLNKPLYVAEYDPEIADLIEADLRGLGFTNLYLHRGDLATMPIRHKIDFAFIDLLGTLNAPLCRWMRDVLAPRLTRGARLALTMAYCRRNNNFMAECERIFVEDFPEFTCATRERTRIEGHQRLIPVMLISSIFREHDFAYRAMMKYQDSNYSMLTYKFTDFKRTVSNGSPLLDDILSRVQEDEDMTDRSEAARKAAVTRKENQRKAALSERAKKAWRTRRGEVLPTGDNFAEAAMTEAEKRTRAARKAWATRRANGWVHPAHRAA